MQVKVVNPDEIVYAFGPAYRFFWFNELRTIGYDIEANLSDEEYMLFKGERWTPWLFMDFIICDAISTLSHLIPPRSIYAGASCPRYLGATRSEKKDTATPP